jgi:hypothetical protein
MRTKDVVIISQICTHANGDGLLAAIHMERTHYIAQIGLPVRLFLKQTDTPHIGIHLQALFLCQAHRLILSSIVV